MSRGLSVMMLAVSLVVSGCGSGDSAPSAEQEAKQAEVLPAVEEPVDFWFYTHCGVENARVGDVWWVATKPLYGENGVGDPPEGWGNPYQKGRLTVLSSKRAVFEARGVRVALVPSATGEPLRICS